MLQGPNWLSGGVGGDFRLVERKGAVGGRSVRSKGLACPDGHQKGNRTDASFYSFPIWELRGCFPYWEMERSEEHTSELQSLMRISYAVFCLKKKIYNFDRNYIVYGHYYT